MNKIKIILTSLFLLMVLTVYSQTRQAFLDAAESSFAAKDYYSALHYYKNVLEYREDIAVLYKAAESARLFNSYRVASQYYQQVKDLEQNGEFPLATYWLAEMQQRLGDYEMARENYQMYLSENELDNPYFTEAAQRQIEDCDWAVEQKDSVREFVTVEHLGNNINTPFSEYGPIQIGDTLYYSSLRFPSEEDESKRNNIC